VVTMDVFGERVLVAVGQCGVAAATRGGGGRLGVERLAPGGVKEGLERRKSHLSSSCACVEGSGPTCQRCFFKRSQRLQIVRSESNGEK
jgi:hypothetical protein